MIVPLALLLSGFVPVEPALLAPGPDELDAQLAAAEARIIEAEAIGRALARLHNRWGELAAAGKLARPCQDEEARSIAARTRVLGHAHRDAVQSARAQRRRAERVAAAPTVAPAVDAAARRKKDALFARVDLEAARYLELRAWQHRFLEPAIVRCTTSLVLQAAPGLKPALPCAAGECPTEVAIIGIGGGHLCPGGQVADGSVMVARSGYACHGSRACDCVPVPVLPGAVIGP